jgi:Zn-dependent peptidase ImmA (M78 family)
LAASYIGWSVERQIEAPSELMVLRDLRGILEANNLLVLQLPLGERGKSEDRGHRGFSLYDSLAPLIAVNSAYNYSARIFSYVHELGHLFIRNDSICSQVPDHRIERWCEQFAAAFLLPRHSVAEFVIRAFGQGPVEEFAQVQKIARHFKVSLRAVTVRLIQLDRANQGLYELVDTKADFHKPGGGGGGGATSPQIRLREWGARYPRLLLQAEELGLLGRQDLLEYLNLSSTQLRSLEEELTSGVWSEG